MKPQREQLPSVPVPAPPPDPACQWCGDRPAELYEVEPPILSTKKQAGPSGRVETVKTMKRRAIEAYACKAHRDRFDQRKAETEKRKADEAARKKAEKAAGRPVL